MCKLRKKHPCAAGLCAIALVLIAAALWYTRPLSFAELTPGFDRVVPAFGGKSIGESTWQVVFGGDYALIIADAGLRCSVSEAEQFRQTVFELLRSAGPDGEQ